MLVSYVLSATICSDLPESSWSPPSTALRLSCVVLKPEGCPRELNVPIINTFSVAFVDQFILAQRLGWKLVFLIEWAFLRLKVSRLID